MTAIIKKNFRLQNARDFLDNFLSHPRSTSNHEPAPLENDIAISVNNNVRTATYSWDWDLSEGVNESDAAAVKKDSVVALERKIGAHIKDRNHYLFIGKTTPWLNENGEIDATQELFPAPVGDSLDNERRIWDEMLGLKKISDLSASLVVPRVNWDSSGQTIYAIFDDLNTTLHLEPTPQSQAAAAAKSKRAGSFYVLTDEYDLFVCLENAGGSPSTEKPIRRNNPTELIKNSDGYVWKYMTTIRSGDAVKFLTDSWIPVKTLSLDNGTNQWLVQESSSPGSILSVVVVSTGDNYNNTFSGRLVGASTEAGNGVATLIEKDIVAAPDPSGVSQAYQNTHLYVNNAVYKITNYDTSNGQTKITILGPWQNNQTPTDNSSCDILPIVTVTSNGTALAKIKPIVLNNKIVGADIINPGLNASHVSITVQSGSAGGSGAELRAVLGPTLGLGKDIEKDLNAFFVMMNARLSYNEGDGDFPITNDYRQIGIIRNVLLSDGTLSTKQTLSAVKKLTITFVDQENKFLTDQIVTQTLSGGVQAKGIVIDVVPILNNGAETGNHKISIIQTPETGYVQFETGSNLLAGPGNNPAQATIIGIDAEEIKKFSGEMLYVENRRPILRAEDQLEDIKAIIEF